MSGEESARTPAVIRAGVLSLGVGFAIFVLKLVAWWITGSTALLADALESVVNVVAAALVTLSVAVAARPADDDHPYGHGKAESLSAGVEGGLILFAAAAILFEAVGELVRGARVARLEAGMLLAAIAALGNLGLGGYLVRTGRRHASEAVEADGLHILTDVATTAGALAALLVVRLTDWYWLDPVVGILVALNILRTGWQVVRRALSGLLDEADVGSLEALGAALERARRPDWVDVHQLRTRRAGPLRHIDLHLVVPRYYTIDRAHQVAEEMEKVLSDAIGEEADVVAHVDPCRPWQCVHCEMEACPVRAQAGEARRAFDVGWVTRPGRL